MKLSVIISTFNEENNTFYKRTLQHLKDIGELEVIVVDKCSSDRTCFIAKELGHKVINSQSNSRGKRLDEGLNVAQGKTILFYHPRSFLEMEGINALLNEKDLNWGGFTHQFDQESIFFKFTSWYSNRIRGDIREIYYLDHCIYVKKKLLERIGGFPHSEIFEDTEVSLKLREISSSKRLKYRSITSSIRFKKNGSLRQGFLNQVMKVCYHLKIDKKKMNTIYEMGLSLNSKYEE